MSGPFIFERVHVGAQSRPTWSGEGHNTPAVRVRTCLYASPITAVPAECQRRHSTDEHVLELVLTHRPCCHAGNGGNRVLPYHKYIDTRTRTAHLLQNCGMCQSIGVFLLFALHKLGCSNCMPLARDHHYPHPLRAGQAQRGKISFVINMKLDTAARNLPAQ
eukprot:jgi/Ulvmu1/6863/UM031_0068.1